MRWFIILVLVLFSGCLISKTNQLPYNEPVESSTMAGYYYEMPEEQQKILFDAIKEIKLGDTYDVVKEHLGIPSDERIIKGKQSDAPVRGFSATYDVKILKEGSSNTRHDKYIDIVFDTQNKVVEVCTNIEEIAQQFKDSQYDEISEFWQILGEPFALYKSD